MVRETQQTSAILQGWEVVVHVEVVLAAVLVGDPALATELDPYLGACYTVFEKIFVQLQKWICTQFNRQTEQN